MNNDGYGTNMRFFRELDDGGFCKPYLSEEYITQVLGADLANDSVMVGFLVDAVRAQRLATLNSKN